jgi:hypothetical protein
MHSKLENSSVATGGSTGWEISDQTRTHLLVWCFPEGQCLFHMPALLYQADSLMRGQAQKSNLKKIIGRYMTNHGPITLRCTS